MNLSLTYEKLLDFPNSFKKQAEKYQWMTEVLSKAELDKYNIRELKANVDKRMQKFKDAKYIYQYPNEKYNCPITTNYQPREVMAPRNLESQQSRIITREVDKTIWINQLYYSLMEKVTTKLTIEETVYLIDSYFKKFSEESIADNLSICKKTLQKIKKSCLIKVWVEMEALREYEDFGSLSNSVGGTKN